MRTLRSIAALFAVLALPSFGLAPRLAAEDVDVPALYKKVVKSCVFIVTPMKGGYGMGSGSLIDVDKKLILTNFHVVDEEDLVFCQFPVTMKSGEMMTDKQKYMDRIPKGQAIKGKVLYRDKSRDLALVRLDRVPVGTPAIPLAKNSVQVGETTWNIGSPGELKQVFGVTEGKVRSIGIEKFLVGGGDPSSVFEIRAKMVATTNATNPGDSGGPLFNKKGYQVAVTQSGSRRADLVNHFVDISEVRAFLNEKKITIKELTDEPDPKPVLKTPSESIDTPPPTKVDTPPAAGAKKDDPPAASPEEERAAASKLRSARLFAQGEENRADFIRKLKEIVTKWPTTAAGKEAKRLLDGLK